MQLSSDHVRLYILKQLWMRRRPKVPTPVSQIPPDVLEKIQASRGPAPLPFGVSAEWDQRAREAEERYQKRVETIPMVLLASEFAGTFSGSAEEAALLGEEAERALDAFAAEFPTQLQQIPDAPALALKAVSAGVVHVYEIPGGKPLKRWATGDPPVSVLSFEEVEKRYK